MTRSRRSIAKDTKIYSGCKAVNIYSVKASAPEAAFQDFPHKAQRTVICLFVGLCHEMHHMAVAWHWEHWKTSNPLGFKQPLEIALCDGDWPV